MKRLISWLLALTLIVGLLPMSVFAAVDVETGDGNDDEVVDFWELLEGGSEANPLDLTTDLVYEGDLAATVTVPAGKTLYCISYRIVGMNMTINDGEAVVCTGDNWNPYAWTIKNETEAEATYTIKVAFPEGHQQNPKVIETFLPYGYSDEVVQAEGDNDGFFYIYTATETGTITMSFNNEWDANGDVIDFGTQRDIMVTNNTTYAQYSLLNDGVDNYGLELTIPVTAGDEIIINTAWVQDADGNYYPAGTYSWTGNFAYPAGTVNNPIALEWTWDDAYANATASATVAAGETVYYTGTAGMILTVDGVETAMDEMGVFSITNSGDAEATYALALATPVGAYNNPEVIEDMNDYSDTNSLEADASYYYIWTATEDGTVTLDVTDGANLKVDKLTYTEDSEWPISTQYVLAEYAYSDDWSEFLGWTAQENLVIEVVAGEQLKIEVVGYSDADAWTVPAVDYTLTGDFEAAVNPVINFKAITVSFDAEIKLGLRFILPDEFLADEGAKAVVTKYTNYDAGMKTTVTEYSVADLVALGTDSSGRTTIFQGTASGEMTAEVTYEFYDGNGNKLMITDYSNNEAEVDIITRSVLDYAENALTKGSAKIKALVTAMLVYGGYAQINFKVDSANPAYNLLTELGLEVPDISGITSDTITQVPVNDGAAGSGYGIYQSKQTPGLDSAIYLRTYWYVESGYSVSDYTFAIDYVDAQGVVTRTVVEPEDLTTRYGVTILNIPGAYLDHMYTLTATNNETGVVYTAQTSVMAWVKSMLAGSTNVAQVNMGKAMYYYSQAANTYFGK